METKLHTFLISTPDEGDGSVSATEKKLRYPLNRKLGRTHDRSGRFGGGKSKEKISLTFNLLKPSGFFTYHQGLIFKNSTWCSLCFECFVRISEQTVTFALDSIN